MVGFATQTALTTTFGSMLKFGLISLCRRLLLVFLPNRPTLRFHHIRITEGWHITSQQIVNFRASVSAFGCGP